MAFGTYQETENVQITDLDVMVAVAGVQEEETGYSTLTYVILNYFVRLVQYQVYRCGRMKKVIDN